MSEPKKTATRRAIYSVAVINRVGRPTSLSTDLDHLVAASVDLKHVDHEKLGPGIEARWKDMAGTPAVLFIPITNIRSIAYTEREEPVT